MNVQNEHRRRRRAIYLLPNLLTSGALFAGFYGIIAALNSRFEAAAIAVFIAMLLDGMDGRIARMTNTQSDFGKEYDSLADMVSFGVAPALIAYQWMFFAIGKLGWTAAFIYTAAAALRLARFNSQFATADKHFFKGLPSPGAAALVVGWIWFGDNLAVRDDPTIVMTTLLVTVGCGMLMVSDFRYHSFKEIDFRNPVSFVTVLAIVVSFVLVSLHPAAILALLAFCYAVSGPLITLVQLRRRRAERRANLSSASGEE